MTRHYKRITVKVGSNVLTRPDGTLDTTRVSHLVDQIATLRHDGIEVILISSGAVACGRSELKDIDPRRLDNVESRQLFSAVGQVKLINRYYDLFQDRGIRIGQVLTAKESFATRRHYLNQRACMKVMLDNGILPIVNENDTVSVTELMFTDNDELSGLVAAMMGCDALVILSNIDGIYTGDPSDPASTLIAEVSPGDDLSSFISTKRSSRGRGGMTSKYKTARQVADEGIEVIIANGTRPDILTRLIGDSSQTPATHFLPSPEPTSSLKRWIAHSQDFTKGSITLNPEAAKTVTTHAATSILPVGVTAVNGEFLKDDLIDVLTPDGNVIGVGRTSYSSEEARSVIGTPRRRPIIHCDYLYIEQ